MNRNRISGMRPRISVLMPTFNQGSFICRALESLLCQTMTAWELLIVDDGSSDGTHELISHYLAQTRIHYYRLNTNQGLGAALNYALTLTNAPLIAYLPSDDVYYTDHLASLANLLDTDAEAVLAYSGVHYEFRVPGKGVIANRSSLGQIEGCPLQLVQVMHRLTADSWVERDELVTDDLDRMFWSKLRQRGHFVRSSGISCQWVDHPQQRHKVIQEPLGGINPYRVYYSVKRPLRFHASTGNPTDEVEHYRRFRERPSIPFASDGLKILLVGELSYNPERVLALEERGHKLYGLWTSNCHWFNTVGPLPFGHVEDLPRTGWREAIQRLKPDVIYALLNWVAVPLAHQILSSNLGIPFVWHFKEGPFDCIANGTWHQLMDLYTQSDGQIYINSEMRDWFATIIPSYMRHGLSLILDGDLPKRDWFTLDRSTRLSATDGQIHIVIPGGPIGLDGLLAALLAQENIHLHIYGDFVRGHWRTQVAEAQRVAPDHLHLHPHVTQEHWVSEFSQYDAGWLHIFKSENKGDLHRATWNDLNFPARVPALVAAGLPMIQYDNRGAIVSIQSLVREFDLGLFYTDIRHLNEQLRNEERMSYLRSSVWHQREKFTFDFHTDHLIDFFRQVIEKAQS